MSYRKTFTEAYSQAMENDTTWIVEEGDHEVSMARGELEAIADKALKLSTLLQGKTDEGNPLEAWVQSKITKAKDYINSVSDYMEYTPDTNEAMDYGLKGTINDKQLSNIKDIWKNKTKRDITPGVRAMLAKLDTPTKVAIQHAKINVLSDLVKEEYIDEKVADSIIRDLQKAYGDLRGKRISPEMATKISKHLDGPVYDVATLRQLFKANIPFISTIARNKIYKKTGRFEELEEKMMPGYAVRYKDPKDGKRYAVAYKEKGMATAKMLALKGAGAKDISITKHNLNFKEAVEIEEGKMKRIATMFDQGKSAEEIANALKLSVSTVKSILGEEKEDRTQVKQDKDIKDKKGTQPAKYYAKDTDGDGMSKATKDKRAAHFKAKKKGPAPGDAGKDTKPSVHTKKFKQMYGEDDQQDEACWTGYKQVGLKDKNGRKVPNCVPEGAVKLVDRILSEKLKGE